MMSNGKVVLLAGGGGHTAYALALAQQLYGKCVIEPVVPEGDDLSFARLREFGTVKTLPKPRGPKTRLGPFLMRLGKALFRSLPIGKEEKVVMVSTGSNFCVSPCLVAKTRNIPIVNIESSVRFVKASKTAKILSRIALVTALQWEEQKKLIAKGEVFGPLLPNRAMEPTNNGYILVTGGTSGHKTLFDAVSTTNLDNVVLQAGPFLSLGYGKKHPNWKVIDYTHRFHELIAGADTVITHFGETILDSALVYRKPTIIAVNPEWTRTAGLEDARMLARKVNAVILEEMSENGIMTAIAKAKKLEPPAVSNGSKILGERILAILQKM